MSKPRGIRNHNPGNIERGDPWQGLAEKQTDPRFCVFRAPKWGIRALARVLITYQDKHGLRTVRDIISRWAPAPENNVAAYVDSVCERSELSEMEPLNLHDWRDMRPLVEAMIHHENGVQPYSRATIVEGLRLAGIEPPAEREVASKGAKAASAAGAGAVASWVASDPSAAAGLLSALQGLDWRVGVAAVLAALGAFVGWLVVRRLWA
jgi:hypothetical protein